MRARCVLTLVVLGVVSAGPVGALVLAPGFEATVVARGLARPTAAAFAPDGRLFMLQQGGQVRLWKPDAGLIPEAVIDLPSCDQSEMGLLGLTFDPAFATNGFLYLYHTHPPGGDVAGCATPIGRENRIVRVTVVGDTADPASLVVLFGGIRTDNGNHDGGGLAIGPDGFLYAGVGDTGRGDRGPPGASTNPYAQDPTSPEGKILRLTLDGLGAPGNPFAGRGGASDAVYALGLRNPWRITFQPGTGLLWTGDVGQVTWEEIDVVRAGDDLGWPRCEGTEPVSICPGSSVPPVYQYRHGDRGASVTGGVFYDGAQFAPAYRGNYFFGDYVLDLIWRGEPRDTNDGFVREPQVFARDAAAPVNFTVGPDGALYYVAFTAGEVRRIRQVETPSGPESCSLRLGRETEAWLRRAGRIIDACVRQGGEACFPPPPDVRAGATAALTRRIARRCAAPPLALCARLACAECQNAAQLAACAVDGAGSVLADLAREAHGSGAGACARAAFRAEVRVAAARLGEIGRCARQVRLACSPASGSAARGRRRLGRACQPPPDALCAALTCASCDTPGLAGCLSARAGEAIDPFAQGLYGRE